jgi:hypothetical protein
MRDRYRIVIKRYPFGRRQPDGTILEGVEWAVQAWEGQEPRSVNHRESSLIGAISRVMQLDRVMIPPDPDVRPTHQPQDGR